MKLPHSEESERAVLAAILLAPNCLSMVSSRLAAIDFYVERHQLIYRSMLELSEAGTEIDLRTLQAQLQLKNSFEAVGGMAYLASLDLDLPDLGRVESYVELVKERSIRRQLIEAAQATIADCLIGGSEADKVLGSLEGSLLKLRDQTLARNGRMIDEAINEIVPAMEEGGGPKGLNTGFYDLDAMVRLLPGALVLVAGRPGMGKTSLAVNLAQGVAMRTSKVVAIFSLEMTEEELVTRILSSEAGIPFGLVRDCQMSEDQWGDFYAATRKVTASKIFIDDAPGVGLADVGARARQVKARHGLDLVIIDYLQLMKMESAERHDLKVGAISVGLKRLAKELEVPIVALSQLSRQTEHRAGDHRPRLSDLRDSGSLEQDADIVLFVYRDEIYNKDAPEAKGMAELIVAKQRNGATGKVDLVFDGPTTTFKNLSRWHS
jgi:replicative DNA helicase